MLKNLRIGGKLGLGFGAIYIIFIILFLVVVRSLNNLSEQTNIMYGHPLVVNNAVSRVDSNIGSIRRSMKTVLLSESVSDIDEATQLINMYEKMILKDLNIIKERFLVDKKVYEDAKNALIQWKPVRDEIISLQRKGEKNQTFSIIKSSKLFNKEKIEKTMGLLRSFTREKAVKFLNEASNKRKKTFSFIYSMLLVTSVIIISIMIIIARSIIIPINNAIVAVNEIKKGDYGRKMHFFSRDEIGDLATTINEMSMALKESYTRLEHKVKERTKELDDTNKELRNEITERKKTEWSLIENEKRLSQILQGIPIPLFVINRDNIVTHWNKACEELTGIYSQDVVWSDKHSLALYESERPLMADLIVNGFDNDDFIRYYNDKLIKTGIVENAYMAEDFFPKLGEGGTWLSFAAAPIKDIDENIIGAVETFQDISERKKADEMIKNERMRFLTTLERIPAFVCLQAMDYTIKYANNKFRSLFGNPEGKLCYKVMKKNEHPCKPCETFKVFDTHELHTWEWKRNERETYLLYDSYINDIDGSPLVIEMGVDITEQKMAEAKIREYSENLEEMVRERTAEIKATIKELNEFAYIVSHDLKAPLRAISNLSEWIGKDYSDKLDDEGKEKISLLLSRVKRMDNLIDAILKYSRTGRSNILYDEVDLNAVVVDTIELISPPDSIMIKFDNNFPTIKGDPVRLEQVFLNLLNNAIKFMDKERGVIDLKYADKETYWEFAVIDNGIGIDEKYHEKIFKIFQTLSPLDEVESTGIGLAIVKKIIELYNGQIRVESTVGSGSTFVFTLPK